jgi:hypothetical protein
MDDVMPWVVLALLGWLWGAGSHYWPGPLGVLTSLYRHWTKRWSDADVQTQDTGDDDVRTDTWEEVHEDDGRIRHIRRMDGPRPLEELLGEDDEPDQDDEPDDDRSPEARRRWVAMQVAKGRRATDIQRDGAARYGCTEKTIQRDRDRALAARPARGTMRRDR